MSDSWLPSGADLILPILPLRNSVLFPVSVVPVNVGRPRSVRLIEDSCGSERPAIGVVGQIRPETEDPTFEEIHHFGTIARVLKVIRLSTGNYSVVLQGVSRMRVVEPLGRQPCLRARLERIHEQPVSDVEIDALTVHLREAARGLSALVPSPSREASTVLDNVQEPGALADLVASNLPVSNEAKQTVLQTLDIRTRLRRVLDLVNRQSEVYRVKREISTMVKEEMSRSQREFLLRQQLKTIKQELGEADDEEDDIESLRERVAHAHMPTEAEKAARKQLGRMRAMSSASAEYQVARTYVEWLVDLPWSKLTPDRLDVANARRVLDEDHFGLERVKKRILEYIAVRRLRRDVRGPILCFVGPPGVGKTSLARSIARAAGRRFVRISLGGVHDEAEIRGHRRTYVGAFPGRVISGLKKVQSTNPVMILDEVDKMGTDYGGDPSAALLEVLDPEQNRAFVDHYIDVPFDLSKIMFIATANRHDTIPSALLDRMERIDITGYTQEEKHSIARQFLVPKQLSEHGLSPERLEFSDEAIARIVEGYTREAGVRGLEQKTAAVCRAVAVRLAQGEDVSVEADTEFVEQVLGPARYETHRIDRRLVAGVAHGLAWTPSGGDLLLVEARHMPGSGKIHLTGQMSDIMKESVAAAFTYVRTRAKELGLPEDFLTKVDVHVHVPASIGRRDGAAQGIPVFVALASNFTRLRVRPDVGLTGELTLRGNVLRVEGIKEKCLAAHRSGIRRIVLPRRNEADLDDVPSEIVQNLDVRLVSRVDEVLDLCLESGPEPAVARAV